MKIIIGTFVIDVNPIDLAEYIGERNKPNEIVKFIQALEDTSSYYSDDEDIANKIINAILDNYKNSPYFELKIKNKRWKVIDNGVKDDREKYVVKDE
jgi:hypothetical protein